MEWIQRMARRVRLLIRRTAAEQAMDDEFRHHIECEIADRIRGGMTRDEARRTALRDFGGIEAVKEYARDERGGRALDDLGRDLAYAVRVLRRNPVYTVLAVLTFALGVGAVAAIYSVFYGILLRPLPYAAPDRLVVVWERNIQKDHDQNVVSLDNYEAWRDRARSFQSLAAVVPSPVTIAGGPAPERLAGAEVTPGYFGMLGVPPALGRDFSTADASSGFAVILSDAVWRRRFNADPSIVGRAVALSGKPYTVVGVMPAGFDPPRVGWLGPQDLWLPFHVTPQSRSWGRFLIVLGRLGPGVSVDRARAEMVAIAARRAAESPSNDGWSASVMPLAEQMTADVRASLLVLLAAVALLLVISVANVATLTLSILGRRSQELAVRRAIGATDRRLFRQLFTQSALVGVVGAAAGALVAFPALRLLVRLLPPDVPRPGAVALDGPVLLVTTAVSLAATVGFGCVAGVRGRPSADEPVIARESGDGRTSARVGSGALMTVEIAVAVALCVMAVLMTRSFTGLRVVDLGFVTDGVTVGRVALPDSYATDADRRLFVERLVARVRALPGATAAGVLSGRPFGGIGPATSVHDARRPADPQGLDPVADVRFVDAGVFAALGMPLPANVTLDAREGDAPRVLISETLARTVWNGGDPVGQTLSMQMFGGLRATVAGVVPDIHLVDARTRPRPVAYLSASRFPDNVFDVMVRVDGDPAAFIPSLRTAVASLDAAVPLYEATTLPALVERSLTRDRLMMLLLWGFATIALLLAAVGVFGVFAGTVTVRRKEIGIRLALGARGPGIILMLLRQSLARIAVGIAAGAALAAALGRGMQSVLFGVGAADPLSFVAVAAGVTGLALAATLGPALHAFGRSPLAALREG